MEPVPKKTRPILPEQEVYFKQQIQFIKDVIEDLEDWVDGGADG